jgi:glutamine synthetase
MCRLPVNRHCLEVRTADAAVNYYLGIAMVLAAGLDGIERKLDPGEPLNVDTYKLDPAQLRDIALPATFERSLAGFESDDLAQRTFGKDFHRTYFEYMSRECQDYQSVVTDWEMRTYLQRI